MPDNVTNELVLEHLKAMQADISEIKSRQESFSTELRTVSSYIASIKHDIASLVESDVNSGADFDALTRRVERIERRLEIVDGH